MKGVDEPFQRGGLLHKIQVPPLEVLNEGQQGGGLVVRLYQDTGHLGETGQLGGPKAALARNELVPSGGLAHGERLQDPIEAQTGRQLLQAILGKGLPGLIGVGSNGGDGEKKDPGALKEPLFSLEYHGARLLSSGFYQPYFTILCRKERGTASDGTTFRSTGLPLLCDKPVKEKYLLDGLEGLHHVNPPQTAPGAQVAQQREYRGEQGGITI